MTDREYVVQLLLAAAVALLMAFVLMHGAPEGTIKPLPSPQPIEMRD